jgi:hypothetical protein
MPEQLSIERLFRAEDPSTSLAAAIKASKASRKAVAAVQSVMCDGKARIDEEIWQACRSAGYISSYATVRHGRLALSEGGELVETGATRKTSDGSPSREWIASADKSR